VHGATLDAAAYSSLASASSNVPPQQYRNVDPDMFGRIVKTTAQPFTESRGED
jgi:hypothetical protein